MFHPPLYESKYNTDSGVLVYFDPQREGATLVRWQTGGFGFAMTQATPKNRSRKFPGGVQGFAYWPTD